MRVWLKEIRKQRGLSTYQAAEKCNICQSYYSSIESGVRGEKLPVPTAKKIGKGLEFPWMLFYQKTEEGA